MDLDDPELVRYRWLLEEYRVSLEGLRRLRSIGVSLTGNPESGVLDAQLVAMFREKEDWIEWKP